MPKRVRAWPREEVNTAPLGFITAFVGGQLLEQSNGLFPQWANAPFIPFAVKSDSRLAFQIQVPPAQIGHFLNPRPGVVEEQEECAVA